MLNMKFWLAVAQMVEQSLPTPKVHGSNPVIDKLKNAYILSSVLERRKINKKRRELAILK